MGYFSNGCEGDSFHAAVCAKCVHDLNGKCPVWNLHLAHNYDQFPEHAKSPEAKASAEAWAEVLDTLIPTEGPNAGCRMFHEASADDRIAALPWKREREGRVGDRFELRGVIATVTAHCDGKVFYTSQPPNGAEPIRGESTVEAWHKRVANVMDLGATFTPAN
jgi:hypothetical protein